MSEFRYRDQNANLKAHIRTIRWVVLGQFLVLLVMGYGWVKAREDIRIHIPPDLRSGGVVAPGHPAPANVFAFASYIFQQLNRWPENGHTDFGGNVYKLSAFLTPAFREFLIRDIDQRGKRGELQGRTRAMQILSAYAENRVDLPAGGVWIVYLDVSIVETVRGMQVKSIDVRYPLRIVQYEVDPEMNPWGLALDGYTDEGPRHLTEEEIEEES